jgi:hypothetical protein
MCGCRIIIVNNSAPYQFVFQNDGPRYSDINLLLDQILNITDQSLDEAQVS